MSRPCFVQLGHQAVRVDQILRMDTTDLEQGRIQVFYEGGQASVEGPQAIEIVLLLKPSLLESRRLRWIKHAWAFHNLVAHPVMQLLAFFGWYRLAFCVHDATVPKPTSLTRNP